MRRLWPLPFLLLLCLMPGWHPDRSADESGPSRGDWADDGSPLPTPEQFAELAHGDPVAMLDACLRRGHRELDGYRATLVKRETIHGVTHPEEEVAAAVRFRPYSVRFVWKRGAREADRCLYVEGEHGGKILVRPTSGLARMASRFSPDNVYERPLSGPLVRSSSRYAITDSHVLAASQRSWRAWSRARRLGRLHLDYQGVREVPEVGGRRCHVLVRTCDPPEEEGVITVWIAIDAETWQQVGTRLTAGERLIGYYYFRDVELNPPFAADTFTREGLVR
jgi:Protein of unknown function (DUF1571)